MPVKKCNKIRCFVCYSLKSIIQRIVRVLSLRSSVIHGFVTEPWYSHHVRVFVCIHCFVWSVVFGFRHSCLEFRFVSGFGHSRSIFCHCVSARSRVRSGPHTLVHVCFVVLHAVRVSIGSVHLCYILCCVARSLYIHWLRAFMLSCVNTWLMSFLISCVFMSCFVHGWWFVCWPCACVLFCVSTWLLS